jgi:hypothetical protein
MSARSTLRHRAFAAIIVVVSVTVAQGGHELPIYPSFYPHEIEIRTLASAEAAERLRAGKLQAYVGPGLTLRESLPADVQAIASLGSLVILRANPESARVKEASCDALAAVARDLGRRADGFTLHPYPVTPFHGDYLHHADLAAAATARISAAGLPAGDLRIRARGDFGRYYPAAGESFDIEIVEIGIAELVATHMLEANGLIAPPWLKDGWWHALLVLGDGVVGQDEKDAIKRDRQKLITGDVAGLPDRINVERDLVRALTRSCSSLVAGYTTKREYVNAEFSAGIENIGYDSLSGLASPMFIRTVKLKDFPWNGWLMLGMQAQAASAWNPIGGMTDPFARLLRFAVGDPALMPEPYDAGFMLNRIADLPANANP